MFKNEFNFSGHPLVEGHRFLTRSVLFFGLFAVLLAGLIFLFPAFIGILAATFILVAGMLALIAGYRIWKLGDRIKNDVGSIDTEYEFSTIRPHHPGYYRYRTVRFMRW
ncbi:hypothetical protein UR09_05850 [Candidatus Nitromaritima sp. SCGC AAA799-A02]|nr:hypothetical protein UR09_05850 [Candidatus Nitromaritima sp. SCGC AAA799-A02]KMP11752.1 hypothetical protein UZ36_03225 [Candidatus Nitromaritima sp. SCGC AAA799-C22]